MLRQETEPSCIKEVDSLPVAIRLQDAVGMKSHRAHELKAAQPRETFKTIIFHSRTITTAKN